MIPDKIVNMKLIKERIVFLSVGKDQMKTPGKMKIKFLINN